jgi:hypothetical protein
VTVRVRSQVAIQLRELAEALGWQLADLQRTLICVGVTFFFLSLGGQDREEAARTLLGGLKLLKPSTSFSLNFSERPYAFRIPGRKSTLMTLNLPRSIRDLVAAYAGLMRASRNETYSKCLQQGLLIYLKAQTTILQASRE